MNRIDHLKNIANMISDTVKERFPHGGGKEKVSMGDDGESTRLIDKVAEDSTFEYLEEENIDWNIISEEAGAIIKGSRYTLILDPIDGTHNAISSIPFYSTSLGILDNEKNIITDAIVKNIPTGDTFVSTRGGGAYLNKKPIITRKMNMNTAVISSYFGPESKDWVDNLIYWPSRTRYFGCISLEICLLASASIDLFVMFGRIPRLTDIAAASLILEEAGGGLYLLANEGTLIPFGPDFHRKNKLAFFAIGDSTSLREVMEKSKIPFKTEEV